MSPSRGQKPFASKAGGIIRANSSVLPRERGEDRKGSILRLSGKRAGGEEAGEGVELLVSISV